MKFFRVISFLSYMLVVTQVAIGQQGPSLPNLTIEGFTLALDDDTGLGQYQNEEISKVQFFNTRELIGVEDLNGVHFFFPGILQGVISNAIELERKSRFEAVWSAKIGDGDLLFIQDNGRIYGEFRINSEVLVIQSVSKNTSAIYKYNKKSRSIHQCLVLDRSEVSPQFQTKSHKVWKEELNYSTSPTIKVLILYTQAVEDADVDIPTLVNTIRAQWLSAQNNSNVYTKLEIAGAVKTDFVEYQGPENDAQARVDVLAIRDHIPAQQARDAYEADVVMLLTNGNYDDIAGIAPLAARNEHAYGLTQAEDATRLMTFIHELGHILGADHEFEELMIPGENHGHEWDRRIRGFPYGRTEKYSTIMRRDEFFRDRVLHFSNPYKTHSGKPTGEVGVSFNANVINIFSRIVCDYRINPPSVAIYGPANAESGDRVRFTSGVSQGQAPHAYQWYVDSGTGYYPAGKRDYLEVTMPGDNDLLVKLTVTDADGRVNSDTHFTMNTYYGGGCDICPDRLSNDKLASDNGQNILVYPNPATDYITLKLPADDIYESYEIVSSKGQVMGTSKLNQKKNSASDKVTIDVSSLVGGGYFVKLKGQNKHRYVRFIKQ